VSEECLDDGNLLMASISNHDDFRGLDVRVHAKSRCKVEKEKRSVCLSVGEKRDLRLAWEDRVF
jgi:hypothetical protein